MNEMSTQASLLPLLYGAVEPFDRVRHGALRLRDVGQGFARAATSVPVALEEFAPAARFMPIVFGPEPPHMPVALLSLHAAENRFVGPDGEWRPNSYMPAYLRRYPFLLVRAAADSDQLVLCLDPTAPQLSKMEGEPLFDAEGAPAAIAIRAFEFARHVEASFRRTREMTEALLHLGLLQPAAFQFDHDGKPFRVDGFHAIERERLMSLTAEQFLPLRDKGWLEPIHAHLLSLAGIAELKRLEG